VLGIVGAGNSGTIIAALVAPRVADHLGWHAAFALAIVPVAIVWVVFTAIAKEPPTPAGIPRSRSAVGMLVEADARWLCAFYLVTFGGFVGLTGYLPIFYVDRFGLTPVSGAAYAALCAAAGSLLRPVGGAVADRFGGTTVLTGALAAIAVLAALLATGPGLAATVILLFVLIGAFGIGNGAVFQLVGCRYPAAVGPVTGLVGAAGGVGGFLLVSGFGWLTGATGTFGAGFALLGVVAAGAALAAHTRTHTWRALRIVAPELTPEMAV
jgi:NNP family nitrate/nitrite transporter-like MFS transporter